MAIKVIVADDTALYRKALADILSAMPGVEMAGVATNGALALALMERVKADVIFLDIYMPKMDGLETLAHLRAAYPAAQVVMVSSVAGRDAGVVVQALRAGALDFIRKPGGASLAGNMETLRAEVERALGAVRARLLPGAAARPVTAKPRAPAAPGGAPSGGAPRDAGPFALLAIGASTGGPEALAQVIQALPENFPAPIVIVQHMPPVFTGVLAETMDRQARIRVREAKDGDRIAPGVALLAPGGRHMTLRARADGAVVALNDAPPENSCRPSVDALFRSAAACFGGAWVMSVILTGMGVDGLEGVRALKKGKCYCMTQSRETCVIYGMPRAVEEGGLSDRVVPLYAMAGEIARMFLERRTP